MRNVIRPVSSVVAGLALVACGPSTIVFQAPGHDAGAKAFQDDRDATDPAPARAAAGDAHLHLVEPPGVEDAAGVPIAENEAGSDCTTDPRVTAYAPDLLKVGALGALRFTLLESRPAPPAVGSNSLRWSIVTSDSASPGSLAGDRKPFHGDLGAILTMPDHLHPATTAPAITYDPSVEEYTVDPTHFVMAGVWRVELDAHTSDDGTLVDSVAYFFCVASRAAPLGPGGL
jgi:hypothetical protein